MVASGCRCRLCTTCRGMMFTQQSVMARCASLEVEFQRAGEARDVPIELALQGGESRRQLMHAARRVIRREPAGIVFCGPSPAGLVIVA